MQPVYHFDQSTLQYQYSISRESISQISSKFSVQVPFLIVISKPWSNAIFLLEKKVNPALSLKMDEIASLFRNKKQDVVNNTGKFFLMKLGNRACLI